MKGKLGSLFDGSGGFPLAGLIHGIDPVWASEIEPFPIRVTKNRFPDMKHLGSVTDVNGAEVEPVDIITFGSPCQDLSVAGKQKGIHAGERSNLFFEAMRIIKEMRNATANKFPRFAVWENVPGAFSSNKGDDFRAVLQAFAEISSPFHSIPRPADGRWNRAGCIVGDGWSLAWRVYDAQFWGVPQRRKRIYLIADFGSERAGEILFKPESVCRNPAPGGETGQGAAHDAEGSAGRSDFVKLIAAFMGGQGAKARSIAYCDDGSTPTLKATPSGGNTVPDVVYPINTMVATRGGKDDMRTCFGIGEPNDPQFTLQATHEHAVCYAIEGNGGRESNLGPGYPDAEKMYTLNATENHAVCYAIDGNVADRDAKQNGMGISENVSPVLNTQDKHAVCYPAVARSLCARHDSSPCYDRGQNIVCFAPDQNHCGTYSETDISATLNTRYHYGSGGDGALAVYDARGHGDGKIVPTITGDHENRITDYTALALARSKSFDSFSIDETVGTIKARDYKQSTVDIVIERKPKRKYIVRRLTPTECARLQGFPDWWCDGADGSDSAKYKMWGNGIALPCAADVLGRISNEIIKEATDP